MSKHTSLRHAKCFNSPTFCYANVLTPKCFDNPNVSTTRPISLCDIPTWDFAEYQCKVVRETPTCICMCSDTQVIKTCMF